MSDTEGQPQQDAMGFSSPPKKEKYNTHYLVGNLKKDRMMTQIIVTAVAIAAVLGAVMWLFLMPSSAPEEAPAVAEEAMPVDAVPAEGEPTEPTE